MININELRVGSIYEGNSLNRRKIIAFWKISMGRPDRKVKSANGAIVEYVWVDDSGNELSKTLKCEASTFVKWANETDSK
ncbi:hypothetical protein NDS46_31530 (plasmid) [Paenibacillus thiaminolyticus]|uniref:hypothetical protein n=1 Tax=Paenibacillus thiaminolyticus TaxID=49283 RepID=UPI00233134CE|nr:hypothetical protein [Paenibacillus thiaminolyticus]WCF11490.1 hypothetical protein NDS46_31530 [Paenibacillus thiaminolyticus]